MRAIFKFTFILLSVFIYCSCKKTNNTTTTVAQNPINTAAYIDSMSGTYTGLTTGDSIYTYTTPGGIVMNKVYSFSWPDTLTISSPDTATLIITSKYYTATLPYSVGNTFISTNPNTLITDTLTIIQNKVTGKIIHFIDTTSAVNHVAVSVALGNKSLASALHLYKR